MREHERWKRERAYEEPWQLAKSLGPVPGENYSRYEFTGGAGLQSERSTVEERWGERVQRIAVESPSCQIRQESWSDLINLETRAASQPSPFEIPPPNSSPQPCILHPRLIVCGLTTLSRLSNYPSVVFCRPRFSKNRKIILILYLFLFSFQESIFFDNC